MNEFYVYMYLREDGTPYYVGKGKDKRAYSPKRILNKPSEERIVFPYTNLTEEDAFQKEIELIAKYGRKDNGTGILRNLTNGGEGSSGYIMPQEAIEKVRQANLGRKLSPEHKEKLLLANSQRIYTAENKEKLRLASIKANTGKKRTEETRKKIGLGNKGKIVSLESREKMKQAWKIRLQTKALQAQNAGLDNFLSD